jgi:hypothetical protein
MSVHHEKEEKIMKVSGPERSRAPGEMKVEEEGDRRGRHERSSSAGCSESSS